MKLLLTPGSESAAGLGPSRMARATSCAVPAAAGRSSPAPLLSLLSAGLAAPAASPGSCRCRVCRRCRALPGPAAARMTWPSCAAAADAASSAASRMDAPPCASGHECRCHKQLSSSLAPKLIRLNRIWVWLAKVFCCSWVQVACSCQEAATLTAICRCVWQEGLLLQPCMIWDSHAQPLELTCACVAERRKE